MEHRFEPSKEYKPSEVARALGIKPIPDGKSVVFKVIGAEFKRVYDTQFGKYFNQVKGPSLVSILPVTTVKVGDQMVSVRYSSKPPTPVQLSDGTYRYEPSFELVNIEGGRKIVGSHDQELYYYLMINSKNKSFAGRDSKVRAEYEFDDKASQKRQKIETAKAEMQAKGILFEMPLAQLKIIAKKMDVSIDQEADSIRHDISLKMGPESVKGTMGTNVMFSYSDFRKMCLDDRLPIIGHIQEAELRNRIEYKPTLNTWFWVYDVNAAHKPIVNVAPGEDRYETLASYFFTKDKEYDILKAQIGIFNSVTTKPSAQTGQEDDGTVESRVAMAIEREVIKLEGSKWEWADGEKILGFSAVKGESREDTANRVITEYFENSDHMDVLLSKLPVQV